MHQPSSRRNERAFDAFAYASVRLTDPADSTGVDASTVVGRHD